MAPLRIGILGCAEVAGYALLAPAKDIAGVEVAAVASRNANRAGEFCKQHGISRALSYEALIDDPEIDAIYNPLPNTLHTEWNLRALAAGKHVLCEKPLANNEGEARMLADAVRQGNAIQVEAMHWRYHPIATKMLEIIRSGKIGVPRSVDVEFLIPSQYLTAANIRYDYGLGGGVTMDCGCYCLNLIRSVLGEPERVLDAQAELRSPDVDVTMRARLEFANGARAGLYCTYMAAGDDLTMTARITGTNGTMLVDTPFMPHLGNFIEVDAGGTTWREEFTRRSSYHFQLEAFLAIVLGEAQPVSTLEDAVMTARAIDAIYDAANLKRRGL